MPEANTLLRDQGVHCPICGYNLTGAASSRCSECGASIEPGDLIDPLHWTSGKRAAGVIACLVCAAASLIGLFFLMRGQRRLVLWDGLEVVAVGVASAGHVGLAALLLTRGVQRPSSRDEAARLILFAGIVSVAMGVVAALPMLQPRMVQGVRVASLMEFALTAALFVMPGAGLLLLRALIVIGHGAPTWTREQATRVLGRDAAASFVVDVIGEFSPRQVQVVLRPGDPLDPERQQIIERHWEAELAIASAEQRVLYDGALLGVRAFETRGGVLKLTLAPTSYKEFLATNLDRAARPFASTGAFRSDALGVSALPVTSDGFLVLGLRGRGVAFHAGWVHLIGGMAEPSDVRADGAIDLFASVIREACEELSVRPDEVTDATATAIVRDVSIMQPELIFACTLITPSNELERRLIATKSNSEHERLIFVPDEPDDVARFLRSQDRLTPVAQAALLLHGKRDWSSTWYERQSLLLFGDLPKAPSAVEAAAAAHSFSNS